MTPASNSRLVTSDPVIARALGPWEVSLPPTSGPTDVGVTSRGSGVEVVDGAVIDVGTTDVEGEVVDELEVLDGEVLLGLVDELVEELVELVDDVVELGVVDDVVLMVVVVLDAGRWQVMTYELVLPDGCE